MALLRYTALRLALFVVTAIVLWLAGVRPLVLCALVAVLVSGLVSVVVLRGARTSVKAPTAGKTSASETSAGENSAGEDSAGEDSAGEKPAGDEPASATPHAQARSPRPGLLRRFNERIDAMAAKEDAADDALRAAREKE